MKLLTDSTANHTQLVRVEKVLNDLLREVLQDEFHGMASLELAISDGTIQRIARSVQRVEKIAAKKQEVAT